MDKRKQPCSQTRKENISKAKRGKHTSPQTEFQKGHPKLNFTGRGDFQKGHVPDKKAYIRKFMTRPEIQMQKIIQENNLPFNFVGDGKVILGGFNPDFLSKNPKHIIEVFGNYWHSREDVKERDQRRLKSYSNLGYKTLVIWDFELKNPNQVLNKIQEFLLP